MSENYSVLVVEDNLDIAMQLVDFLAEKGFTMDFAHNGKDAINLLESERYDLVILDLITGANRGIGLAMAKQYADILNKNLLLTFRY